VVGLSEDHNPELEVFLIRYAWAIFLAVLGNCTMCAIWFVLTRMSESATAANLCDSIVCPWGCPDCGNQYWSRQAFKKHQRNKGHGDIPPVKKIRHQKILCPVADCDQWWVISGFCFPVPSYGLSMESVNSFKEYSWQLTEAVYGLWTTRRQTNSPTANSPKD